MVYFFVSRAFEYLLTFIGVALLYCITLLNFNCVLLYMVRRGRQTMYAPQIYDNTTRFYANKFTTFDLWKIKGYNQSIANINGRRTFT